MQPRHALLPFAVALTSPATLLAAQSTPTAERAEEATRALRRTRVLVSAREVRVIFPPDTTGVWSLPPGDTTTNGLRYHWGVSIDGIDGPRILALDLWHTGSATRTFPALRGLVSAATPGLCTPGMFYNCSPAGAGATVDRNRVVLTFRDAGTIRRLFGLRPDSVKVTHRRGDDGSYLGVNVAVEYVRPGLPHPDSAFRAEAARAKRRWEASITSVRRHISGGPDLGSAIRIAVGDSISIEIKETTCIHDFCNRVSRWSPMSIWSVDDTALARLRSSPLANAIRDGGIADSDLPRTYLVGLAPGRTTLRARFPARPEDDTPLREPPARALEREVIVSARPDVKR